MELGVELVLLGLLGGEDELAHDFECVLALGPFGDRPRECVLHFVELAEEDVFLAREVGEDRSGRDISRRSDFGQGRGLVAALDEELVRRTHDRLARPLLLAFP